MPTADNSFLANTQRLKEHNYKDDSALTARKSLYDHLVPPLNIEAELFQALPISSNAKDATILDVGCGNGDLLVHFRRDYGFTGHLTGIDISSGIMAPGLAANEKEKLGIDFRIGNADQLDFPDNYFDAISCKHVLYHVPNIAKAVSEAHRCLKPDGRYLVFLNSEQDNLKIQGFRDHIARALGYPAMPKTFERLSVESFPDYLKQQFPHYELKTLLSDVVLTSPEPAIQYLTSLRYNFDLIPSEAQLAPILSEIRSQIDQEIKEKGQFTDHHQLGLFIAQKAA